MYSDLKKLNNVTLALQAENCTLSTVRYISDELIAEFPSTEPRLSPTASIAHNKKFDCGIIKRQKVNAGWLSDTEKICSMP